MKLLAVFIFIFISNQKACAQSLDDCVFQRLNTSCAEEYILSFAADVAIIPDYENITKKNVNLVVDKATEISSTLNRAVFNGTEYGKACRDKFMGEIDDTATTGAAAINKCSKDFTTTLKDLTDYTTTTVNKIEKEAPSYRDFEVPREVGKQLVALSEDVATKTDNAVSDFMTCSSGATDKASGELNTLNKKVDNCLLGVTTSAPAAEPIVKVGVGSVNVSV